MALRRTEDGGNAQGRTYHAIEKLLGLPDGALIRAIGDDVEMVNVARHVGIPVPDDITPTAWVEQFAATTIGASARISQRAAVDAVDLTPPDLLRRRDALRRFSSVRRAGCRRNGRAHHPRVGLAGRGGPYRHNRGGPNVVTGLGRRGGARRPQQTRPRGSCAMCCV